MVKVSAQALLAVDATPMHMAANVVAATADAIKYHLDGRADEFVSCFGSITIAHDEMSAEEIDAVEC